MSSSYLKFYSFSTLIPFSIQILINMHITRITQQCKGQHEATHISSLVFLLLASRTIRLLFAVRNHREDHAFSKHCSQNGHHILHTEQIDHGRFLPFLQNNFYSFAWRIFKLDKANASSAILICVLRVRNLLVLLSAALGD